MPVRAALLAAVLAGVAAVVGVGPLFFSDEGAVRSQIELVDETGEWTLPNPAPDVDPDAEALPIDKADRRTDGRWAPYAKHPLYVALGTLLEPVWLGVAGTVAAAWAAAALVGPGRRGTAAFWLTGLGTPLLFDSQLAVAHAPAAGLCAWAAVLALRPGRGSAALRTAAAAALVLAAGLLRAEATLLGLALAGGALAAGRPAPVSVGVGAAAVAGRVLNALFAGLALGGDRASTTSVGRPASDGFVLDRLRGLRASALIGDYRTDSTAAALLTVGTVLFAVAVLLARRRPAEPLVAVLAVAGGTLVALRWLEPGRTVPGLLLAVPALLAGWLFLRRDDAGGAVVRGAVATTGLFAAAVVATQYADGGGVEWGGRYFAVGLPVAVVPAVHGLDRLRAALPRRTAVALGAALAVATAALALLAVEVLRRTHDASEALRVAVVEATDGGRRPVVTTSGLIGRTAWRPSSPGAWFTLPRDDLAALTGRLREAGERELLLVSSDPDADLAAVGEGWEVVSSEAVSGNRLLTLSNTGSP